VTIPLPPELNEPIDNGSRLEPYWREWCAMGDFLREERGLQDGLEYLIGDKFLNFLIGADVSEAADFAREILRVFTADQMKPYFKKLMRTREPQSLARTRYARELLLGK
jgi:hypothetical protein